MTSDLTALLALSTDLLLVCRDHRFDDVNARCTETLGWAREELVGRHFADLIHPDDLAATAARTTAALEDGEPTTAFVNRYRTKDGSYRWLLWETRPLDDGRWLCAARDITREREALAERERLLHEHRALRRVATEVARGRPAAVFAAVAEEVGLLLEATAAGVLKLHGPGRLELMGGWAADSAQATPAGTVFDLPADTPLDELFGGGARHLADASDDEMGRDLGFGSSVTAPIRIDGRDWGLVTAVHARPGGLAPDAAERLDEFAALAALAVANADARQELERRAVTDSLTSLLNHGAFHARLGEAFATAARSRQPLALILLDIDHFKTINDRCGHRTGDGVLVAVAETIRRSTRPGDVLGRVGGDELAIALPDCDTAGAHVLVERIRLELAATPTAASISAGVADSAFAATPDELFGHADEALYRCKTSGRDRTSAYH